MIYVTSYTYSYRLDRAAKISLHIEKGKIDFIKGDRSAYEYTVKAIDLHQTVLGYVIYRDYSSQYYSIWFWHVLFSFRYVDLVENCYNAGWLVVLFMNMLLCGGGLAVVFVKNIINCVVGSRYLTKKNHWISTWIIVLDEDGSARRVIAIFHGVVCWIHTLLLHFSSWSKDH